MESNQSQAAAELLNMIFGYIKPMILKCALDLGIPHEISNHGQPMTLTQLHAALSLPHSKKPYLFHLLRALVHFGFIYVQGGATVDSDATYDLTPVFRLMTNKEGTNLFPFAHFQFEAAIDLMMKAFQCMGDWFKQDDKKMPFEMVHGCGIWELASRHSKLNEMFNDAMVCFSSTFSETIIKNGADIFKGVESLVDVAGGTGRVAKEIATNFPHVRCTVMDLPHVVHGLPNNGTVKFVSGDMFDYIPPADAVLLKSVLHCFGDEDCIRLLKGCKDAISSTTTGGKVIINEPVVGSTRASASEETQLLFDMLMLSASAGAERDEDEWKTLFMRAGFSSCKIVCTVGFMSIIEVYPWISSARLSKFNYNG